MEDVFAFVREPEMLELIKSRLRRVGNYRVIHSRYKWGFDLFDDLDKLLKPEEARVVFDVGANEGNTAKLYLEYFPKATIHAFEPVESTFSRLRHALQDDQRVRLHRLAASDLNGTAKIRKFENSQSSTLNPGLSDHLRASSAGEEQIETIRLDALIPKLGIQRIDFMKIDVEGFEKNVLLGCGDYLRPDFIRFIFFECYRIGDSVSFPSTHTQLADVNSLLDSKGYRFITLYTEALARMDPVGSYNALYGPLKLELAVSGPPLFG
jgi:FkbM family methyltransferase